MQKILVPIFSTETDLWAIVHGSQLVERINGKIYLLEFIEEDKKKKHRKFKDEYKSRGDELFNLKTKEGNNVHIRVKGDFFKTCINFIMQERIDLVVLSIPHKAVHIKKVIDLVRFVKAKKLCNVELVKK